jgi:hypothetical protein
MPGEEHCCSHPFPCGAFQPQVRPGAACAVGVLRSHERAVQRGVNHCDMHQTCKGYAVPQSAPLPPSSVGNSSACATCGGANRHGRGAASGSLRNSSQSSGPGSKRLSCGDWKWVSLIRSFLTSRIACGLLPGQCAIWTTRQPDIRPGGSLTDPHGHRLTAQASLAVEAPAAGADAGPLDRDCG